RMLVGPSTIRRTRPAPHRRISSKGFCVAGRDRQQAFEQSQFDASMTAAHLTTLRGRANIISYDKLWLIAETSDGAFIFINNFASTIDPSNIPGRTEAVEHHCSGIELEVESICNLVGSTIECKPIPRLRELGLLSLSFKGLSDCSDSSLAIHRPRSIIR